MKVRSVLKGVMIAVGVIFLLGIISTLFDWGGENVKPKQYDYKITYLRADTGEDILKDYSFMLKRNGNYPEGYSNDSAAFEISALAGTRTETDFGTIISEVYAPNDPETGYCFGGWYLDAACTQAFDGYVKRGAVGNMTLYAKIYVYEEFASGWSDFY